MLTMAPARHAAVVETLERRALFAGGPPGFEAAIANPPPAFVAAEGATLKVRVTISNHGTPWGVWPIQVLASADETLDDADVEVGSIAPKGIIYTGRQKTYKVHASFAGVPDGTYRLFARAVSNIVDPPSAVSSASTPVAVVTPAADLAVALKSFPVPLDKSPRREGVAGFEVSNAGNGPFAGTVTLHTFLTPFEGSNGATGGDVTFPDVTTTLRLRPGQRKVIKVHLTGVNAAPDGYYRLKSNLTAAPPDNDADNDGSDDVMLVGPRPSLP